ncbi:MAG: FKBP-type peptidyl-prolyl cis-trans isomerase, partial [Plesiomonas sp.]
GNSGQAAENRQAGIDFLAQNKVKPGVMTTDSGLQYQVLQAGTGTEHPTATDTVTVHYHGTLIDGTVFDSSVERGEPIALPLNRVIKGWTEGIPLMVVGEKTRFFIPNELAYGNRAAGKIPSGAALIFDVELLSIKR